jgi:hypothetical protein
LECFSIEMTQTGWIAKIVKECGLDSESKWHKTPAITKLLQKTLQSLRGSINRVITLTFAVHQCARFSSFPMQIH